MNDPLMPQDPRTPHDAVEVALTTALANLSSREVRPSMVDVQDRAHRRQRRQAAAMVGALVVVVLGGVGVLALRRDDRPLAITAGDGSAAATTIACVEVVPTTVPALDPTLTTNVDFGLTTTTVDPRLVKPPPTLPPDFGSTTTDPNAALQPFVGNPCSAPNSQWRCQGPLSTTADGWTYYQYCEPMYTGDASTVPFTAGPTTSTFEPALYPTTTYDPKLPPVSTISFPSEPTTASNP